MADTPTPHYGFLLQQPGTNRSIWGGILNGNWSSLDSLLFTATGNAASALALATAALPRAGGTMTGNIVLPTIASSSSAEAGFKGAPGIVLTAGGTKTLTNTDGGRLQVLPSGNNTVTIAPGLPLWMVIPFKNQGSGTITIARGAGVTLTVDGSSTNKNCTIGAYGKAVITQNSANNWSVSGVGVS